MIRPDPEAGKLKSMALRLLAGISAATLSLIACSGNGTTTHSTSASTVERAAAAQTNPPGDIPDTQAFVSYASPAGYSVLFPDGWSRSQDPSAVSFTSDYDGEQVAMLHGQSAAVHIRAAFAAVRGLESKRILIHGTPVTLYTFTSTSRPNQVTGRSIRLENNSYVFSKGPRSAVLDLWAPQGADNVDQWRKISQSFRWR